MRIALLLFTLALAVSCGPTLSTGRNVVEQPAAPPDAVPPPFPTNFNQFKNGDFQASKINIPVNFNTTLNILGKEVDDYIRNDGRNNIVCFVSRYEQSMQKTILVQAARPSFRNDFATNTQEFLYILEPNSHSTNSRFCNTSGVNAALQEKYPDEKISYDMMGVCPSCPTQLLIASSAELLLSSGNSLSRVMNINYLYLDINLYISPDT